MSKIYNLTAGRFLANKKRKKKARAVFLPLCLVAIILTGTLLSQPAFTSESENYGYTEQGFQCPDCETDAPHGHADGITAVSEDSSSSELVGIAARSVSDGWDLYNFVTGVVIRDGNGQVIDNGSFYYDQEYSLNISFAERTGANGQLSYNTNGCLVYQLPEALTVTNAAADGVILLSNGVVVGHYTISADGCVEIWFEDVDNQGNPIEYNFIDRYTDVRFNLNISALFEENAQSGKIWFGNATVVDAVLTDLSAGLKVEKTASAFSTNTETIDYEIKVTAVDNAVNNITLADTLTFSNGFAIKDGDGYPYPFTNLKYLLPGGEWTDTVFIWDSAAGSWILDLPSNTGLQAGQSIDVKYTLNLSAILDYCDTLGGGSNIPRLTYDTQLNNTAEATGMNKSGEDLSASATTQTPMKKNFLTKKGSYSSSAGEITWTAVVGDGSINLNGMTLTDTWPATPTQTLTGNVTINLYNQTGSLLQTVTIVSPYTTAGFASTDNGFTYLVPSSPDNICKVEFIYNTTVTPPESDSVKYSNTIQIDYKTTTTKKTAEVNVTAPGVGEVKDIPVTKDSEWIWSENGTEVTGIKYTMEVTVPAGLIDPKFFLKDQINLTIPGSSSYSSSYKDVIMDFSIRDFSLTLEPSPQDTAADPELLWTTSPAGLRTLGTARAVNNNNSNLWEVYFGGNDITKYQDSKWQYTDEKTIYISYTISLADSVVTDAEPSYTQYIGYTLEEMLKTPGWSMANRLGVFNSSNSMYKTDLIVDYFPIQKEGNQNASDSSLFDYTVYLDWTEWSTTTNKYPLFTEGAAIFEDTFDSRLEYVPGSFYVEEYRSTSNPVVRERYGPYSDSKIVPREDLVEVDGSTIRVDFSKKFVRFSSSNWTGSGLDSPLSSSPIDSSWYYNNLNRFKVHYQLRLKDEYTLTYPKEPLVLDNTASVYCTSPDFDGKWSDSSSVTYGPKAVTKDMLIDGNTAAVEIVINPDGRRLRSLDVSEPQITAVDTMNGALAFYLHSIKIYTQTKTDGVWDGEWIELDSNLWSMNSINAHTVEFELPDEQPIKIKYNALITAPFDTLASFSNKIEVCGYIDVVEWDKYLVKESSASASGTDRSISLFKEDELTGVHLTGAKFELYMYTNGLSYDNGSHKELTPSGSDMTFYHVCDAVYGNGNYDFSSEWITPSHEAVYLIVETEAPRDYNLPNEPYTFFVIHSIGSSEMTSLETKLGREVEIVPDNLYISNTRPLYELVISATKKVVGEKAPKATFSFTLTQVADETGKEYEPADEAIIRTRNISTNGEDSYGFSFPPIEDLPKGTYYFKIQETGGASALWNYDTSTQIVKIEIDDNLLYGNHLYDGPLYDDPLTATITVLTSDTNEITFTNIFGGPEFPEVGGIGKAPFTMITVLMTVLISMFFGGRLIYRKLKRRRCMLRIE